MATATQSRRAFLRAMGAAASGCILAACQPKVVKETVIVKEEVEKVVKETVVVEGTPQVVEKVVTVTPPSAAPAGKTVVRVQTTPNGFPDKLVDKVIEILKDEKPELEVLNEPVVYHEILTKTETGFIGGNLQDICHGHPRWYYYGCVKGFYAVLDEYIASDFPDIDDFYPMVMEANKWDGKQYALPFSARAGSQTVVTYNLDLLRAKGFDAPKPDWTWEDLIEMALVCADKDKHIIGLDNKPYDMHDFICYTRCWGENTLDDKSGSILSPDGKEFRFLNPEIQEATGLLLRLVEAGVGKNTGDTIEGGFFPNGLAVFAIEGPSVVGDARDLVKDRFEWGWSLQPTGPKGRLGQTFEGNQWMINSQAKDKNAAWEVMKRLTDKDVVTWFIQNVWPDHMAARRSLDVDTKLHEGHPEIAAVHKVMDTFLEPFPMPYNTRFQEVNDTWKNLSSVLWNGEESLEAAAGRIQDKVQAVVDLARPAPVSL